jgi:hypothetical protein
LIVPHLRLPLGDRLSSPIERLVIGPCPHPSELRGSVELLAAKHSISLAATNSRVPYRRW